MTTIPNRIKSLRNEWLHCVLFYPSLQLKKRKFSFLFNFFTRYELNPCYIWLPSSTTPEHISLRMSIFSPRNFSKTRRRDSAKTFPSCTHTKKAKKKTYWDKWNFLFGFKAFCVRQNSFFTLPACEKFTSCNKRKHRNNPRAICEAQRKLIQVKFYFYSLRHYSTESRRVCMDLHCCSIDFRFSSLRQSFFYREVKLWKCNLWIKSEAKASSFSTFYEVLKGALRDLQGTSLKVSLFLCDR